MLWSAGAAACAGMTRAVSGTGISIVELMILTKVHATVAGVVLIAVVGTSLFIQQQSIEKLRTENRALSQEATRLRRIPDEILTSSVADREELLQRRRDNAELLALRNSVRQLREEAALHQAARSSSRLGGPDNRVADERAATLESMAALGLSASRGDFSALEKLGEAARARIKLRTNEQQYVLGEVQVAFDVLAEEAAKGNETAFQALFRASQMKTQHLSGLAIRALGDAAAAGHDRAVEVLVNPERYQLLRSSTISALRGAAQNGNPRAIESLAEVARDPEASALWGHVTQGLQNSAVAGNETAILSMAAIAKSEGKPGRRMALAALQDAAQTSTLAANVLGAIAEP